VLPWLAFWLHHVLPLRLFCRWFCFPVDFYYCICWITALLCAVWFVDVRRVCRPIGGAHRWTGTLDILFLLTVVLDVDWFVACCPSPATGFAYATTDGLLVVASTHHTFFHALGDAATATHITTSLPHTLRWTVRMHALFHYTHHDFFQHLTVLRTPYSCRMDSTHVAGSY